MWHGGGWFMAMRSGDEKPKLTRELLLRVLAYARPYWWHIAGMLVTILIGTGLSLVGPLIFRHLIDVYCPPGYQPADQVSFLLCSSTD